MHVFGTKKTCNVFVLWVIVAWILTVVIVVVSLFKGMMMDQLPKRIVQEGTKTQIDKLNNSCWIIILQSLKNFIRVEYIEVLSNKEWYTALFVSSCWPQRFMSCGSCLLGGLWNFQCKNSLHSLVWNMKMNPTWRLITG